MSSIELRYLASREWMESEIASGNAIQNRNQAIVIDVEKLDPELASRAEEVADSFFEITVRKRKRICVPSSGIDPELAFGPSKKQLRPLDKGITDAIGLLPELSAPTENAEEVIFSWEQWLAAYEAEGMKIIEALTENPPAVGQDLGLLEEPVEWGGLQISLGSGITEEIPLEAGPSAIRDARAGRLWTWAASRKFSPQSLKAAGEASDPPPSHARSLLVVLDPDQLAATFLDLSKKRYAIAKAHHRARTAKVPSFDAEMRKWADKKGSTRLRLGIEDGYRMNSQYLAERIAAEAPGMYAVPAETVRDDWASKASSPSEQALLLRRKIAAAMARNAPPNLEGKPEAEIMMVKRPPHQIYHPDPGIETEDGFVGEGFPSRLGWSWSVTYEGDVIGHGASTFEAVVVQHWLGRFHLIGAVADEDGNGPPGIWAVPDPDAFKNDGSVVAQDPDESKPATARRKPPEPEKADDIPF